MRHIFIIPVFPSSEPNCLHPSAARLLKVIDVIRLASLFLGVLSFSPYLHTKEMPAEAAWMTVHEEVVPTNNENPVSEENVTALVGETCVSQWVNRVLWLRLRGKQPGLCSASPGWCFKKTNVPVSGTTIDDVARDIVARLSSTAPDLRADTWTLHDKFKATYRKDPLTCELSGDQLATEMMHIVPFELNSMVIYELLRAVKTRADKQWDVMPTELSEDARDHRSPIIGNVALLNSSLDLLDMGPSDAINAPRNLFVASSALHSINDKKHGLLLSTDPPIWLDSVNTVNSVASFTKEVAHQNLPTAAPLLVRTVAERERYIVRWLADAATMYIRFASKNLQIRTQLLFTNIKKAIADQKQKRRKASDSTEDGEREKKKMKTDHRGFDHLEHLFTEPSDLEYEGDWVPDDERRVLSHKSRRILQDLFNVLAPGSDEVERLEELHMKVVAYFGLLANLQTYG
ncbi:hypothetical protein C8R44DRAFT_412804 [Mycena epipterygia]|nr:hypothetical protein C8R44DRAFT_412804 [Mycena epipterygia]